MGLDQYAWTIAKELVGDIQVDYEVPKAFEKNEIAYWRKFNHLHGWMEKLYRAKGGTDEVFNLTIARFMAQGKDIASYVTAHNKSKLVNLVMEQTLIPSNVRLENEDLDNLEQDLINNKLEYTPGFFFGGSEIYPQEIENTNKFISDAREAIKDNMAVFYDSWW